MRVVNEKHGIEAITQRARLKRVETEDELFAEIQRKEEESEALKKLLTNLNTSFSKHNKTQNK